MAYSGHALVVGDALRGMGTPLLGYCDLEEKANDPLGLRYLGPETSYYSSGGPGKYFVAVGDNRLRRIISERLDALATASPAAIHPSAYLGFGVGVDELSLVAAGALVQPLAQIGRGAIVNTGAVVEHECRLGDFTHVGPNATLAGNVRVGGGSFVGAGAVVLPNVTIGRGAVLGAGAVLTKDIPDGGTWVGNPARPLISRSGAATK